MKNFRYTITLEKGDIMVEIAQFVSYDEAALFAKAVGEKYPDFTFYVDDLYSDVKLEELIRREEELAEMQGILIKNSNNNN